MNEETFNIELRKFLKTVGVTAQREIEGAMKAARGELRAFVADQSVALAEGMIRREIRADDNTRMVNKFIDDLSEVSK